MGLKPYTDFLMCLTTGLFSGMAAGITLVEGPARAEIEDDKERLREWRGSFLRAAKIQATLAVVGGCIGIPMGIYTRDILQFTSGTIMILMMPYTFIWLMPVNWRLLDTTIDPSSQECLELQEKWNRLHLVRTIAGFCAFSFASGALL
mmetsp:Transcript_12513/g.21352  ORF Transcript_12513/g.21352 Transcript_12513/m.21352 type:complete len:148 (-) Transcript_12513:163-606(-)|eukprot:CAMPEP_0184696862 /NCGR_PEP_ID=MMETSP0313-20130426/4029_1 /TAXON_ID=2792 /ORGANISM="Porphyridium aerugineum, Strain SAG 1380-2" /LENGTH=147 /DNA_ID=CAMNT_0027155579 /DNA_START=82 /DNA_END=525 /DNA_ORIENTATION=-